jgi:uncharacterized NAD(P)/FAD-binding protein YdhS
MNSYRLAIIGCGPRGLTVLERLLEHSKLMPRGCRLELVLLDPGRPGEGSHPSDQAAHLLTNTVASQVTMFPPDSLVGGASDSAFVDWAAAQGYRRHGDTYRRSAEATGMALTDAEHLPRVLLGDYLSSFYEALVAMRPASMSVRHVRARVVDVISLADGYALALDDGSRVAADYVVLAIGHGMRTETAEDRRLAEYAAARRPRNPSLAYYPSPYPISRLDTVADGARVAIQGLGLTAHDVVSALTTGRGGSYRQDGCRLVYEPSGREPRLYLCSRNTLPFAARGINQKGRTGRHICRFFTRQAVEVIRQRATATGDARLAFEADVLPLILKEMAFAYRMAETRGEIDPQGFVPTVEEEARVRAILWPLDGRSFDSAAEFRTFFWQLVKDDLAEAYRGNLTSGVKAATDVLRDSREAIRAAVEFGGLLPASHQYFVEVFNAITNRVSFGPPLRRSEEWLALFEAGLLDVAGGPQTTIEMPAGEGVYSIRAQYGDRVERREVDVVIAARLDIYSPLSDRAELSANLLRRGLIKPYMNGDYHPGGIDIDENLHPLDRHNVAQRRLWAIGFIVEGPHFYTHALPRPQIMSRQTVDAERCALALYADLSAAERAIAADGIHSLTPESIAHE